jgi:hypothetical protein
VRPPSRRGAVAARRAHNPKVDGSNPSAATILKTPRRRINILRRGVFAFVASQPPAACIRCWPGSSQLLLFAVIADRVDRGSMAAMFAVAMLP